MHSCPPYVFLWTIVDTVGMVFHEGITQAHNAGGRRRLRPQICHSIAIIDQENFSFPWIFYFLLIK